jgi:hypothetical protein
MSAQILPLSTFRASAQPVADFVRVGETGYLSLADLYAEGRLPAGASSLTPRGSVSRRSW